MYIAHSALLPAAQQPKHDHKQTKDPDTQLRYQAYQSICQKYRREIAAIQQYIPGWEPSPPAP